MVTIILINIIKITLFIMNLPVIMVTKLIHFIIIGFNFIK